MRYLVTEDELLDVRGCGCCGIDPEHAMTCPVPDDTILVTRDELQGILDAYVKVKNIRDKIMERIDHIKQRGNK